MRLPIVEETCNVWGAKPFAGVTVNQDASLAAAKLSVPPLVFVTLGLAGEGLAPPWMPFMLMAEGETNKTGAAVIAYADKGQAEYTNPVVQELGRAVRVVCEVVSLLHPPAARS